MLLKSESRDWHHRVATIVDSLTGAAEAVHNAAGNGSRRNGHGLVTGQPAVAAESAE
jgi:hypothetical protein